MKCDNRSSQDRPHASQAEYSHGNVGAFSRSVCPSRAYLPLLKSDQLHVSAMSAWALSCHMSWCATSNNAMLAHPTIASWPVYCTLCFFALRYPTPRDGLNPERCLPARVRRHHLWTNEANGQTFHKKHFTLSLSFPYPLQRTVDLDPGPYIA